jgi:hypothetical protein
VVYRDHRREHAGAVAILADASRLNMRRMFSSRVRSVVTTGTITSDTRVIEVGWQPAGSRVTVIAVVATRDVRRMFPSRVDTIVARAAGTENL